MREREGDCGNERGSVCPSCSSHKSHDKFCNIALMTASRGAYPTEKRQGEGEERKQEGKWCRGNNSCNRRLVRNSNPKSAPFCSDYKRRKFIIVGD